MAINPRLIHQRTDAVIHVNGFENDTSRITAASISSQCDCGSTNETAVNCVAAIYTANENDDIENDLQQ